MLHLELDSFIRSQINGLITVDWFRCNLLANYFTFKNSKHSVLELLLIGTFLSTKVQSCNKKVNLISSKYISIHFLKADPKQHTLAKYFMELSLHCAEFSPLDPSYLAACSLALSFKLLNGSEWNRTMEFYSTYKLESLYSGMQKIAKLVLKSSDLDYRYRVSFKIFVNNYEKFRLKFKCVFF
jgi:hypothetical protein